jgi:hypothetical protein
MYKNWNSRPYSRVLRLTFQLYDQDKTIFMSNLYVVFSLGSSSVSQRKSTASRQGS